MMQLLISNTRAIETTFFSHANDKKKQAAQSQWTADIHRVNSGPGRFLVHWKLDKSSTMATFTMCSFMGPHKNEPHVCQLQFPEGTEESWGMKTLSLLAQNLCEAMVKMRSWGSRSAQRVLVPSIVEAVVREAFHPWCQVAESGLKAASRRDQGLPVTTSKFVPLHSELGYMFRILKCAKSHGVKVENNLHNWHLIIHHGLASTGNVLEVGELLKRSELEECPAAIPSGTICEFTCHPHWQPHRVYLLRDQFPSLDSLTIHTRGVVGTELKEIAAPGFTLFQSCKLREEYVSLWQQMASSGTAMFNWHQFFFDQRVGYYHCACRDAAEAEYPCLSGLF
ncbi:hypothetical protein FB45DRAFT_1139250 [Roridomyces roridus]|uniref:Uncharacterized protein n=1 Tax=Roridomyces roridus TaxID=1738132 RepID=A0AAD7FQG9_9AGAR|nr:hypothetical protein FB45DRAFT_1139250 [Roridomyces roridus]